MNYITPFNIIITAKIVARATTANQLLSGVSWDSSQKPCIQLAVKYNMAQQQRLYKAGTPSSVSNGHFHLHTRLNGEGRDLFDDLCRALQVDDSLVDPHLKPVHIPELAKLTANKASDLSYYLSQVFEPSPQGVLRVVMRRVFVGIRTGPLTRRFLSLAAWTSSEQTGKQNMNNDASC